MRRTAALILGGGPAGSAAAITLARAGHRPLLLERTREPADALCGGFLSWRTLARLEAFGVTPPGPPVTRLRLFAGKRSAEVDLPAPALGLSRRWLDAALLARASQEGAAIERGVHVREVSGQTARLADGATVTADTLFLAIGKHDIRGAPRARATTDPTIGLRVHLAAPADDLASVIELHLFDRGYAGIMRQEDGRANLCLAVAKSRLTEAGGNPDQLLKELGDELPPFGDRLAWRLPGAPDAIAGVPYGWRADKGQTGCFRLGDQAAVIPSLAGEGMGIALTTGISAAQSFIAGGSATAPHWQRVTSHRLYRPMAVAGLFRHLGEGSLRALLPVLADRVRGSASLVARLTRVPD